MDPYGKELEQREELACHPGIKRISAFPVNHCKQRVNAASRVADRGRKLAQRLLL
jgi:hypothetical protein